MPISCGPRTESCTRNQLANLGVAGNVSAPGQPAVAGTIASYGYDNLYRLTSETIASDPNGVNGLASYSPRSGRQGQTSEVG